MINFCSLYSGSSGNAIFVSCGQTKILVDAGVSGAKITNALKEIGEQPEHLQGILITHEHSDHIKAVGILSRRYNLKIYTNKATWNETKNLIGKVDSDNVIIFDSCEQFEIGDLVIKPFRISHDAVEPVGFNIFEKSDGRLINKITIATDLGIVSEELLKNLEGSDLILLESNHDIEMLKVGPYPYYLKKRIESDIGHLSNEGASEVVTYLYERGTKKFVLGHLSGENNYPELALITTENKLREMSICNGEDIFVEVASRNKPGKIISVK